MTLKNLKKIDFHRSYILKKKKKKDISIYNYKTNTFRIYYKNFKQI